MLTCAYTSVLVVPGRLWLIGKVLHDPIHSTTANAGILVFRVEPMTPAMTQRNRQLCAPRAGRPIQGSHTHRHPWWTPHPVIAAIRDDKDYLNVLLHSYYTTSTGLGRVLLIYISIYMYMYIYICIYIYSYMAITSLRYGNSDTWTRTSRSMPFQLH